MKAISLKTSMIGSRSIARDIIIQETQNLKSILAATFAVAAAALLATYFISLQSTIKVLNSENNSLRRQNEELSSDMANMTANHNETLAGYTSTITGLNTKIVKSNQTIDTLNAQVETLVKDNKSLADEYDELYKKYKVFEEREELYDKYDYVVKYGGKRTDVTYDQIKLGEKLMLEKGYNPDILFSIMMVESRGKEAAVNKRSRATGYGQFIPGTGKFVYEDLLGNGKGTYTHSKMATNGNTNIQMMVSYLDYLFTRNNNNLNRSMSNYSGGGPTFTNKYISWMRGFGGNSVYKVIC